MFSILLNVVVAGCLQMSVTATTYDMNGREVAYKAPYWLCLEGSRPAGQVIPICWESGNPYLRKLWAAPWMKADVEWVCQGE